MTDKRLQVVMLPTDEKAKEGDIIRLKKKGNISSVEEGGLAFCVFPNSNDSGNIWETIHLYILSDEEIKEGDWFLSLDFNIIGQLQKGEKITTENAKKIIATSDNLIIGNDKGKSLLGTDLNNYLPQPSKSFIETFVSGYNKGNIITDVMVEYEYYHGIKTSIAEINAISGDNSMNWKGLGDYRDFKLKVNLKDNTITIKKVKDTYTREEVINKFHSMYNSVICNETLRPFFNDWINKNL